MIYVFSALQVIGIIIFIILGFYGMYLSYKKENKNTNLVHKTRIFIIVFEIILALSEILYVQLSPNLPIIEGVSIGSVYNFGENRFYLSYKTSGRGYSDFIDMDEEELQNISVKCKCHTGNVFIKLSQGTVEQIIDVTNYEGFLDMKDFVPGIITLETYNENARNVKLEITW